MENLRLFEDDSYIEQSDEFIEELFKEEHFSLNDCECHEFLWLKELVPYRTDTIEGVSEALGEVARWLDHLAADGFVLDFPAEHGFVNMVHPQKYESIKKAWINNYKANRRLTSE